MLRGVIADTAVLLIRLQIAYYDFVGLWIRIVNLYSVVQKKYDTYLESKDYGEKGKMQQKQGENTMFNYRVI